jgi:hypothetical protein
MLSVDDPYPHILLGCVHVHKAHGYAVDIGVANKTLYLGHLWALPNDLKHNEAGFSKFSTCLLCS